MGTWQCCHLLGKGKAGPALKPTSLVDAAIQGKTSIIANLSLTFNLFSFKHLDGKIKRVWLRETTHAGSYTTIDLAKLPARKLATAFEIPPFFTEPCTEGRIDIKRGVAL